ncbi:diguanylate cyclase [Novosphingobium sp. RL4]|uniref:sensor domain-containing diguanylate cyclase n=1 Tax=Novosphingobium sp. RL4 TaxID=3109595 RepID=UPI002D773900|nr:diguanylate cyclase [Novosphingobium sp. RL4]WRT95286.1 diguanylate cyclase [Novosphingobium sp. RL4]
MVRAACPEDTGFPESRHDRSSADVTPVFGRFFESVPFAFCILDRARHVVFINRQMAAIAGHTVEELDGACATTMFPQLGPMLERCYRFAEHGTPLPDIRIYWRSRTYLLSFSVTYDAEGLVAELLIGAMDISREARIEARLRQSRRQLLSSLRTDHLTGLLNRNGLASALSRELRCSNREETSMALLLVDVDYFKNYNDCFGHLAGDRCLVAIAREIARWGRRAGDAVGRFGGEEFVMVLPDTDAAGALRVAENCRIAVERLSMTHPESPFGRITVSIGVTVNDGRRGKPVDADHAARCLGAADRALYEAKDAGRNTMRFSHLSDDHEIASPSFNP